jgi:hypothetical protein
MPNVKLKLTTAAATTFGQMTLSMKALDIMGAVSLTGLAFLPYLSQLDCSTFVLERFKHSSLLLKQAF